MLVLTRKLGEEIFIGDDIRLIVNRIAGNRVTIGIKAPDDVTILRGELGTPAAQSEDKKPQNAVSAAS